MNSARNDHHPIAALASGSGPGAVAIIRISGADTWKLIAPFVGMNSDTPPQERAMILRSFRKLKTNDVLDDLMLAWFAGPKSFTGDDTVELYCHGGPYLISEILAALYEQGIQPAKPGEFTKRALLNGKLDLTAAEGIKDLVEAQSKQQWLAGRQLYSGKLKSEIESLRKLLIEAMAWLEAMIDFPDEGDTQHVQLAHVRQRTERVEAQVQTLVRTFQSGHVASQGLKVAFAGAPNAGKSTLFNLLLGHERALVSEIAGTTRDYLEEKCLLDGRLVRLIDMAGIRETADRIEQAGVVLSKKLIGEADVVVGLFASDSSDSERLALNQLLGKISSKPVLKIMTKCDVQLPAWSKEFQAISCRTGQGIEAFTRQLTTIVDQHVGDLGENPFITSARQQRCLIRAQTALAAFFASLKINTGHELLAFELQEAARALSDVIGELSNEDILDKVFSDFCIGK